MSSQDIGRTRGSDIADLMREISNDLETVYPASATAMRRPATRITENKTKNITIGGGESCTVGWTMEAKPLSFRPPELPSPNGGVWTGSEPGSGNAFYRSVQRKGIYVQAHLLNHRLFGPGMDFNLVPFQGGKNSEMAGHENTVKNAVLSDSPTKVVRYKVRAVFGNWPTNTIYADENLLPTRIEMEAVTMKRKHGAPARNPDSWEDDTNLLTATVDNVRQ
jgi:hypothetical protein